MRPSNPSGSVVLCKNLDSVAMAPQLPEEIHSLRERIRSTYVETFTRRATMDEKGIARLFALALGGLFAISLILSAMSI
jgi:hypothetical protein